MAEEEYQVVGLLDDYYRDSFGKVIFIGISLLIAIILLIAISIYLHVTKPTPISFPVYQEWRIKKDVPVDQPYLNDADLLQWVNDAISKWSVKA